MLLSVKSGINLFSPSKGPPRVFDFGGNDAGDETIQDFEMDIPIGDGSPRRRSKGLDARTEVVQTPSVASGGFIVEADDDQTSGEEPFHGIDWREEVCDFQVYQEAVCDLFR